MAMCWRFPGATCLIVTRRIRRPRAEHSDSPRPAESDHQRLLRSRTVSHHPVKWSNRLRASSSIHRKMECPYARTRSGYDHMEQLTDVRHRWFHPVLLGLLQIQSFKLNPDSGDSSHHRSFSPWRHTLLILDRISGCLVSPFLTLD